MSSVYFICLATFNYVTRLHFITRITEKYLHLNGKKRNMAEKPPPYPQQQPPGVYPQAGYNPQQPGYPPQQPGYPPGQQPGYPQPAPYGTQPGYATTTTTIIQQPTQVMATVGFHETPAAMTCPNCRATIVTSTSYVTGTLTWLACIGLCVIG